MIRPVLTKTVVSHLKWVCNINPFSELCCHYIAFMHYSSLHNLLPLLLDNVIKVLVARNAFYPRYPSPAFICKTAGSGLLANTCTDQKEPTYNIDEALFNLVYSKVTKIS